MSDSQPQVAAIIVEQGKILDFIDGKTQRPETPEEYVRQEIAKSLVREYRYAKADIEVEFTVRVGTRKPRADLVIFPPQTAHEQEHANTIVECKAPTVKAADKKDGVAQLQSYMAVCPNVAYGMWTNGVERFCYCRVVKGGKVNIEEVPDLPEFGRGDEDEDRPRFDQLKPATSDALLFAFRRCHNYIAGNQGLQKNQAFWELLKLIFCKIEELGYIDFLGVDESNRGRGVGTQLLIAGIDWMNMQGSLRRDSPFGGFPWATKQSGTNIRCSPWREWFQPFTSLCSSRSLE
jgi:type I restriction enzyme M protein